MCSAFAVLPLALVAACGSGSPTQSLAGGPLISGSPVFPLDFRRLGDTAKCQMTLFGDATSTSANFTMGASGELIIHVSGPGGEVDRNDVSVTPGAGPVFNYAFPPSAVTDVSAVLKTRNQRQVACTITQK